MRRSAQCCTNDGFLKATYLMIKANYRLFDTCPNKDKRKNFIMTIRPSCFKIV